ncbi:hypothetical protein ETB97_004428 [Aspergillus alliaceus]|uniref:DUF7703 domain-containing protein n=1 Tax=Petromyces alliaceus TaxID=209559 RepID=A0A8H6A2W4_PETAA|nr:hypothetical protein ETB97_004428 [Aspergillus burnettii]
MPEVLESPAFNREATLVIFPLLAIAAYNALELFYWTFCFFRHYRGCYFWSLIAATWGIIIFVTAAVLRLLGTGPPALAKITFPLGVFSMATGGIMVLYARLHLVTIDRTPRYVLAFIVATACVLHLPLTILKLIREFTTRPDLDAFCRIYEHVAITGSCARELIIAGIYLWVVLQNLKPILDAQGRAGNRVVKELIVVNIILLLSDVSLVIIDHTHLQNIKIGYGPMAASIKLKMEFAFLNELVELVQSLPRLNQISTLRLSSQDYFFPT